VVVEGWLFCSSFLLPESICSLAGTDEPLF
jgi:hypothetical protein